MTARDHRPTGRRRLRPVLNVLEVTIIVAGCVAASFIVGRNRGLAELSSAASGEFESLAEKYGPTRNSEHAEEWIVRDFFADRRGGVFVDVGANDYRRFSNTYYLETALGWSGLAVEPQTQFEADYRAHRPRTTFLPLFVSDISDGDAVLNVPENNLVASADAEFAKARGGEATALPVRTSKLDDILGRAGITRFDFLTMDIELAEPAALRGFSIERFQPALVCIEAHPEVRQQVLDYFASHGYVVVGRYLRADPENLWFMPSGS
jgi:FkbM family methyltransferase